MTGATLSSFYERINYYSKNNCRRPDPEYHLRQKKLKYMRSYSSFQTGFLFSRKAFSPSCASWVFMSLPR